MNCPFCESEHIEAKVGLTFEQYTCKECEGTWGLDEGRKFSYSPSDIRKMEAAFNQYFTKRNWKG